MSERDDSGSGDEAVRGSGQHRQAGRTRTGGIWVAVVVAAVVLAFLLVFIVQNFEAVTVRFLWMQGQLPTGVALLFGALAGALLVALIGTARILQLRHAARRHRRRGRTRLFRRTASS